MEYLIQNVKNDPYKKKLVRIIGTIGAVGLIGALITHINWYLKIHNFFYLSDGRPGNMQDLVFYAIFFEILSIPVFTLLYFNEPQKHSEEYNDYVHFGTVVVTIIIIGLNIYTSWRYDEQYCEVVLYDFVHSANIWDLNKDIFRNYWNNLTKGMSEEERYACQVAWSKERCQTPSRLISYLMYPQLLFGILGIYLALDTLFLKMNTYQMINESYSFTLDFSQE
ncbi:hypothetical protein TRFO_24463 [Tritrichomonas foetus]|uniref:Uncharacterized protein n=1 Tax=Tritrichomonas foetus TaxID=1144522 RepID=A0A1J4K7C2_9EUKA|nr:hypothetical protein TRFO_24463 [Tritrichomonas foetus]|eukprot:OHT07377.1 hypothetical protein TRFO_24463 [Tritrichomonas foetus]